MLRRLIALVLALSFGMYYAEALIADVHDGDASVSEVAQYSAGASDSYHATIDAVDQGTSGRSDAPVHNTHTCHAGHAHTCVLQAIAPMSADYLLFVVEIGDGSTRPIDLRQEPQLRPPIA